MPSGGRESSYTGRFGALLRASRVQAGLTQERLARRAGLGVRTIAYLEGGRVGPRAATVGLLADALGLDGPDRARFVAAGLAFGGGLRPEGAGAGSRPPVTPAQLPAEVAGFTGRVEHLARLDALLAERDDGHGDSGRAPAMVIIAIGGTAGVGKTALAVRWAHRVAGRFPDGQLYVNLHGFAPSPPLSPVRALAQLLDGLGVAPDRIPVEVDQAAGLYRSLLASRRVLVVLDNARSAEQLRPLLPGSPTCVVVVTSRERLAGLVASHGAHRLALDVLAPAEAGRLLREVVGRDRLEAEAEAAAALARACGFLPLALRIVAANLACHPDWPVAAYLERVRSGDRLAELAVDGDPLAAVGAAFDSSHASLDAGARRLFRLLGLVPGPDFTARAAAALSGTPLGQAGRLLERLASAHLLESRGAGRYGLHDLLRAYARQRSERDDTALARWQALERLLGWYVHTADAAGKLLYPQRPRLRLPPASPALPATGFDGRGGALAWLDAERANLVAAVGHAAEHGPQPPAWLLADALRGYFWGQRYMVDWLAVASAAVRAADAQADARAQTAARRTLGMAYQCLGDYPEAVGQFTTAVALARQAGWVDGEAAAVGNLGVVHDWAGRLRQAAGCCAQALTLARRAGNTVGEAIFLSNLGEVERQLGRPAQAVGHLLQALDLWREIGRKGGRGAPLDNLGDAYRELGQLGDAAEYLTRGLALHRAEGNRYGEADSLASLAAVHRDAGRLPQAVEFAEAAVALAGELGDPRVAADALGALGSVRLRLGEGACAGGHYEQALDLARRATARYPETEALLGLAATCLRHGRHAEALEHAEHAIDIAFDGGYRILEGRARQVLAAVHLDLGHDGEASAHAEQAVAVHRQSGHRLGQADALVLLGHARRRAGDPDGARDRWRDALALLAEVGVPDAEQVRALLET